MLGCWGCKEGDISCGDLEKEMELGMRKIWWRSCVEVRRVSHRVVTVVVLEKDLLRLICGYAPQSGRHLEEK